MRHSSRTLAAATVVALLAAGCRTSTEPSLDPEALAAATTLDHIADSLSIAGADAGVSSAYRALAQVVRSGPHLSHVIIAVDGTPAVFVATAQSFDQNDCPPQAICPSIYRRPLNSVVAWQRSDPRRIVQLTADIDLPIGVAPLGAPFDGFNSRATLTYLDGAGGVFLGTGGTQSITVTPTDEPCVAPGAPLEAVYVVSAAQCTRADFTVSFASTVQPPPFALRNNTASGSHTLSMAAQSVSGTRLSFILCGRCVAPPPLMPPVAISPTGMLQPTLTANAAGRDITLQFTVKNVSVVPVQLDFNSAQQYDVIVRNAVTGAKVWQLSENMGYATMLLSRGLAPGEAAVYTEQWHATAAGMYSAQALLTSSSQRAMAFTVFNVP
jgi:hypothetical protein